MNARRQALDALCDITDRGAYANLRVKQLTSSLPEREAKLAAALVYHTLDHLLTIDYYLAHFVKGSQKPVIRGILRLGVCELLFLSTPAHAALNESVTLTKEVGKSGLSGFVNAVLRNIDRSRSSLPPFPVEPVARLSIQYSYPEWIVREWVTRFGEAETEALLSRPQSAIEVRAQYPFTRDELQAVLPVKSSVNHLDENSLSLESGFDLAANPQFQEGKFTVMGESAMLACRALGDMRGKRVLDACSAPGGKSAYLASLSQNDISLTCFELHPHRKELLDKTLERLHVSAETLVKDAAEYDPTFEAAFDGVLIDAPCSGLGLLGDKPDIRYSKTDADITALVEIQKDILSSCARYIKPGGVLVYATCTISRRENEAQIDAFLRAYKEFELEEIPISLVNGGQIQLLPHVHKTDGFYIARMRRCI
ncbi:MAG TPA: 16S rRNA (cytosine(967)-C(5))-methyltransferase RsmB [Clostridia bacterium]|nr:16S rRNA (cytosine(967)-C(5))-methyltransferase RsmB [Clostridia bacterium]